MRARISLDAPAANGTTMVMDRAGQFCAEAIPARAGIASARVTALAIVLVDMLRSRMIGQSFG
jgi:hypothetical protein